MFFRFLNIFVENNIICNYLQDHEKKKTDSVVPYRALNIMFSCSAVSRTAF